jgi:ubiquinone/menaquinone biosynthesis C-methylase UbiE
MTAASSYDAGAPSFDRYRALPEGVPEAIRAAMLGAIDAPHPRLLDLGAGTGRIGRAFVAAGDDYVGVDLSHGMLREFMARPRPLRGDMPRLVQADGGRLPFADRTFDAVMLVQVFGGMRRWRRLIAETRRVLQSSGALIIGRSAAPAHGIDAQLKQRLATVLDGMHVQPAHGNAREDVQRHLAAQATNETRIIAAEWNADRTPRAFLDRHATGARFSALPASVREEALRQLAVWANERFGALDAVFAERYQFELRLYKFEQETAG